jgi:5-methylcytosine-specific restriction endonuclease McrBC regulatory subunit McrC
MADCKLDPITCFEAGSGSIEPWIGSLDAVGDDIAMLGILAERRLIELNVVGNEVAIRGTTRVGLVILPSGRRLVIRSKIPNIVLLDWLAYLGKFPRLSHWLPESGVAAVKSDHDDWHLCIARLFLHAMEQVTRQHLRKGYVVVSARDSAIRGRIVMSKLGQELYRLPRVPQLQRQRTFDTSFNIVLALALDRLPSLLSDGRTEDRRQMAILREQWAAVRRDISDPVTAAIAAQSAEPPGYREALQLARLILIGAVLDPDSIMGGQAFTLSMPAIWEGGLRRMLSESAGETGWKLAPRKSCTRRWDDSPEHGDIQRWMTADAIVERAGKRWVLDGKYKNEFGIESRGDRFQMCAYAVAFDADRISLVYPGESLTPIRSLLSTTVGAKRLTIDSLSLPMRMGPEWCRSELTKIAQDYN